MNAYDYSQPYVTPEEYLEVKGVDLNIELQDDDNNSNKVSRFITDLTNFVLDHLVMEYNCNELNRQSHNFEDLAEFRRVRFHYGMLEQIEYVLNNGLIQLDSGINRETGSITDFSAVVIGPSALKQFRLGGFCNKQQGSGHRSTLDPREMPTIEELVLELSKKVDKVDGKGLSTNDFTTAYKNLLNLLSEEIDEKVDKVVGKVLSSNDFTDELKAKLQNIEAYAQANVIEQITLENEPLPVSNKKVNIDVSGKEDKSNKVTEIDENSTDSEYPSAKAVHGLVSGLLDSAKDYTDSKVERDNLVAVIEEAKTYMSGLMSAEDKTRLDGLYALLGSDDADTVVNTINEVLAIFDQYPEGAELVEVLAGKVDKVGGSSLVPDSKVASYDAHLIDTNNPHGVTKAQVGLGNVDNTSDENKPVSTAQQAALDLKANTVGPLPRYPVIQNTDLVIDFLTYAHTDGKPFIINDYICNFIQIGPTRYVFEVESLNSPSRYSSGTSGADLDGVTFGDIWGSNSIYRQDYEFKENKVTSLSGSSTDAEYPSAKLVYDQLALKEAVANKVPAISNESTDTQYPSAKCVYDNLQNVREVAEGKCNTFVLSYSMDIATAKAIVGLSHFYFWNKTTKEWEDKKTELLAGDYDNLEIINSNFNSQADSISRKIEGSNYPGHIICGQDIGGGTTLYLINAGGDVFGAFNVSPFPLKDGDIFLVLETDVPDRWWAQYAAINKLETAKIDLTNYISKSNLDTVLGDIIGYEGVYSSSETYEVGDIVIYNNKLYKCSTAIGTAEAWDSTHWTQTSLSSILNGYATKEYVDAKTYNEINASDIQGNALTEAQFDLITNGKPTLIKGELLSYANPIILSPNITGEQPSQFYAIIIGHKNNQYTTSCGLVNINAQTKAISSVNGGQVNYISFDFGNVALTRNVSLGTQSGSTVNIKGKNVPEYPSSPTIPQSLDYLTNNTLAYEKVTKYNSLYEYASNSTTQLEWETINNISISADTTFTLATVPSNTYPEYKANITNTDTSNAITITLPSGTIIKAESGITVSSNTFTIPADTTVVVSIQDGLALVMIKE